VYRKPDSLLDSGLPLVGVVGDWAEWLAADDVDTELKAIRQATARDIPFADDAFIDRLEIELGRLLRPRKPGRKPKPKAEPASTQGTLIFDA
jgi:hypothetical protein